MQSFYVTRPALAMAFLLLYPLFLPAASTSRSPLERATRDLLSCLPDDEDDFVAQKTLEGCLTRLYAAARPLSYDSSPLSRSPQALLALYLGGSLLGPERGAYFRKRAYELMLPPKRHIKVIANKGARVLKRGDPAYREISLTFDDGPGPYTKALLDVLAVYGVKATFFLIGRNIARYPQLTRRIVNDGHAIGNHSWSHPRFIRLSNKSISSQCDKFDSILDKTLEREYDCRLFRLPYNSGRSSKRVQACLGRRFRYIVDWSIDSRDWQLRSPDRILERILSNPRKRGSIVLMHDNTLSGYLPSVVEKLVKKLRGLDFRIVSLPELLGEDDASRQRKLLAECMRLVDLGRKRLAYRKLMNFARKHKESPLADEALFFASFISRSLPDKSREIPEKVEKYIRNHYPSSIFYLSE